MKNATAAALAATLAGTPLIAENRIDTIRPAHSDTSGHLFRRHMISHSGVSDHPEMTPSGVVW